MVGTREGEGTTREGGVSTREGVASTREGGATTEEGGARGVTIVLRTGTEEVRGGHPD